LERSQSRLRRTMRRIFRVGDGLQNRSDKGVQLTWQNAASVASLLVTTEVPPGHHQSEFACARVAPVSLRDVPLKGKGRPLLLLRLSVNNRMFSRPTALTTSCRCQKPMAGAPIRLG